MIASFLLAAALATRTYVNPVLPMDFSDPDVCVGSDDRFYLTASSFGGLPGLPILVSDDLVNWSYAGHALTKHPFPVAGDVPQHGKAVWAPSIRYRADKGEYVIYWGDPDRGAYRVSAKNPAGPWSEPRLVIPAKGMIDVCPLYDDDGRVYLVNAWAQSRAKMNSVLTVREIDADETHAISDPVMVYDGIPEGNATTEGPKFYKKDGEYWLFFPAGGVEAGWQVAARAKSPYGPYTAKTVLAQGKTDITGPHQGGWVRGRDRATGNGERDWFLHFRDRGAYGREVYLEPMTWEKDSWPVIGKNGEPVAKGTLEGISEQQPFGGLAVSDEFNALALGPQWQFLGKSEDLMAWPTPNGTFRLYSTPLSRTSKGSLPFGSASDVNLWREPNRLVQKFPAESFAASLKATVSAKEDGEDAGLIVQGRSYARIGLRYSAKEGVFEVVYVDCRDADQGRTEAKPRVLGTIPAAVTPAGARPVQSAEIFLRVSVKDGSVNGRARLDETAVPQPFATFAWSADGKSWQPVEDAFAVAPGKWIGATVGVYAIAPHGCIDRGWIDLDWFRVAEK